MEWVFDRETKNAHSFRLCHHKSYSPLEGGKGCYQSDGLPGMHLHHVLDNRMPFLLHFLDLGDFHQPDFKGPRVADVREWVEFTRRLTIPYYEEARLYWNKAIDAGYFDGANEIKIYTEDFLKGLIDEFGNAA